MDDCLDIIEKRDQAQIRVRVARQVAIRRGKRKKPFLPKNHAYASDFMLSVKQRFQTDGSRRLARFDQRHRRILSQANRPVPLCFNSDTSTGTADPVSMN